MTSPLFEQDFCVVDTETTGGSATLNHVIDVAVFRVQGGVIVEKFQSLVNPGRPIPLWITNLTGITDDMVARAPRFKEIAEPLQAILSKGVFTAHNAGFDYGFLQEEFARAGKFWARPQLCMVRLARLLLPELPSRSLGFLCEHLLIDIWDRHRAAGDAEATVYVLKSLLRQLEREHGITAWEDLEAFLIQGLLALPPGITPATIMQLPDIAGSYVLKGENGEPVFKGKAKNVRERIRSHFKKSNQSSRSNRLRELVKRIEVLVSDLNEAASA